MKRLTLGALALAPLATAGETGQVDLTYKTYRTWQLELPAEVYTKVAGELPGGFAVSLDGVKLLVDADGDGTLERTIEGHVDDLGVRSAMLVCRKGEGRAVGYRLKDDGQGWHYAPAGAAVGKVLGTKLQLIDQDGDGRFTGFGTDAMIVGTGKRAQFLSDVINLGGALYTIEVAEDGSSLSYAPYSGPVGTLDFTTELDAEAKLLTAIVRSKDGKRSFDLALAPTGLQVPAGDYEIHSGSFGLGKATVQIQPGHSKPMTVVADGKQTLDWGGPVRAEFAYQRQGSEIAFHPDYVWYYGAAGEQYLGWHPIGKSPEFQVMERDSGAELAKAVFPGSS
ncbi:MAG: hypothetical protein O2816_06265 [Planctomycetota bacterium]|nr:hypothetical protein [Planctomycetota bacterium]